MLTLVNKEAQLLELLTQREEVNRRIRNLRAAYMAGETEKMRTLRRQVALLARMLRECGVSYNQLGAALGVSRQRAHQIVAQARRSG